MDSSEQAFTYEFLAKSGKKSCCNLVPTKYMAVDWFHPTRAQVRNLVKSKLEIVEPFIYEISKRCKILAPDFKYWNLW